MLGKLTRKDQADSSLNLAGGESALLVDADQTTSLGGDALEGIADEGVHDGHSLGGNTSIRVNLLEHLVDVDTVRLLSGLLLLLSILGDSLDSLGSLLGTLLGLLRLLVSSCCAGLFSSGRDFPFFYFFFNYYELYGKDER